MTHQPEAERREPTPEQAERRELIDAIVALVKGMDRETRTRWQFFMAEQFDAVNFPNLTNAELQTLLQAIRDDQEKAKAAGQTPPISASEAVAEAHADELLSVPQDAQDVPTAFERGA